MRSLPTVLAGLLLFAVLARAAGDPPLIEAVRRGDTEAVEMLLKKGADVNARQSDGASALHWAVHNGDLATTNRLLRAGAKTSLANELGVTPLIVACTNGSAAIAGALLDAGADPNAAVPGRETPLMVASWTGSTDVVRLLLARGADVNAREPSRQQTALMWAASEGHPEVVRILIERGADLYAKTGVNVPGRKPGMRAGGTAGYTALLFAVRMGDARSVRVLLDAGADVNDAAEDGFSALTLAAVRGHVDVAKLLLEWGADATASGPGFTALHWAAGTWETTLTTSDITTERAGNHEWNTLGGLKAGKLELVKKLVAYGAEPNARMRAAPTRAGSTKNPSLPELVGATPFFLAAMAGDAAVMQALLDGGADPALTTKVGSTALMAAAGAGRMLGETTMTQEKVRGAAALALKTGADVNAVDSYGNTALHYAAYHRLDTVVEFLVEKGARFDVKNKFGETPLWLSELVLQFFGGGTYQIVRTPTGDLLRKLGAEAVKPSYDRARPRDWPDLALP
jgi:ankyrin